MHELRAAAPLALRAIATVLDPTRSEPHAIRSGYGEYTDEWFAVMEDLRERLGT